MHPISPSAVLVLRLVRLLVRPLSYACRVQTEDSVAEEAADVEDDAVAAAAYGPDEAVEAESRTVLAEEAEEATSATVDAELEAEVAASDDAV